jgi:sec-independent protein translocase protein TatB
MFDITSSKLLILGIVALLVIGPKDLPALLRTIGKYMGIIKRHAADFRAQFDEAMRESELEQLKKEVEKVGSETEASIRSAELSVDKQISDARQDVDALMGADAKPVADPLAHDANALPAPSADAGGEMPPAHNGAVQPAEPNSAAPKPAEVAAGQPQAETAAGEPAGTGVKTGA